MEVEHLIELLESCNLKIESIEGMNWIPLPLKSNSKFVKVFEFIERNLGLSKIISQSPWLLISVKKNT